MKLWEILGVPIRGNALLSWLQRLEVNVHPWILG